MPQNKDCGAEPQTDPRFLLTRSPTEDYDSDERTYHLCLSQLPVLSAQRQTRWYLPTFSGSRRWRLVFLSAFVARFLASLAKYSGLAHSRTTGGSATTPGCQPDSDPRWGSHPGLGRCKENLVSEESEDPRSSLFLLAADQPVRGGVKATRGSPGSSGGACPRKPASPRSPLRSCSRATLHCPPVPESPLGHHNLH